MGCPPCRSVTTWPLKKWYLTLFVLQRAGDDFPQSRGNQLERIKRWVEVFPGFEPRQCRLIDPCSIEKFTESQSLVLPLVAQSLNERLAVQDLCQGKKHMALGFKILLRWFLS